MFIGRYVDNLLLLLVLASFYILNFVSMTGNCSQSPKILHACHWRHCFTLDKNRIDSGRCGYQHVGSSLHSGCCRLCRCSAGCATGYNLLCCLLALCRTFCSILSPGLGHPKWTNTNDTSETFAAALLSTAQ